MTRIKQIELLDKMTADALLRQFSGSAFNARRLADAADILEKMHKDKGCTVFLGIAGALVPAGMRQIFVDLVNDGVVDVVVTTGANITHDLVEAFGGEHLLGKAEADDASLHKKNINRIYDVYMPNEVYEKLEKNVKQILAKMPQRKYTIQEFLHEFGKHVEDKGSFVRACSEKGIPLFCPAFSDSGFGVQTLFHKKGIEIDALGDLNKMISLAWDAKKAGVLLLGGGVPKNFIMQAMQFTKQADYAIQITMDHPEHGGLSGATLDEAVSWGKISEKSRHADVKCDITIALPLLVAALKERIHKG